MRFKPNVREVVLVILLVGILLGWGVDRQQWAQRCKKAEFEAWNQEQKATRLIDVISRIGGDAGDLPDVLNRSGFGSELEAGHGYESVKTLSEALALAQANLEQDNKTEYAVLLAENRIRAAIANAIRRRDDIIDDLEQQDPGIKKQWNSVKPTFVSIADTGAWPAGSTIVTDFNAFDAKGNSYEGLRVSLHILQPGGLPADELSGQRVALTSATVGYLPLVELFFRKDLK
jgi:hypothetical protein